VKHKLKSSQAGKLREIDVT